MNWAYDRVLKALVDACDAKWDESQRYVCPTKTCRGKVHVRGGFIRARHFAHNPGEGTSTCEDYHPGAYEATAQIESTKIDERAAARVDLELAVGNRYRSWRLQIRVSPIPHALGTAEIRIGPSDAGVQDVDLTALQKGPLRFDAVPCDEPLGIIRFHSNVPINIVRGLEPSAICLARDKVTVFHAGRLSGLGIVGPKFYWGASYLALSRNDGERSIPGDIVEHSLGERFGWRCDLIRLPQEPQDRIAAWFSAHSELDAGTRKAKIVLARPSASIEKPGPEIETISSRSVVLGIHRLGREMLNDVLRVEDDVETISQEIHNCDTAMLQLRFADRSERCLYVRFGTEPGVLIECKKRFAAEVSEPIRVSAIERGKRTRTSAPFGTLAAHRILRGLRLGRYRSFRLLAPDDADLELRVFRPALQEQATEKLKLSTSTFDLTFAARILDRTADMIFTLPGYGGHFLKSVPISFSPVSYDAPPIVDVDNVSRVVAARYEDTHTHENVQATHPKSVAQIISDRYHALGLTGA